MSNPFDAAEFVPFEQTLRGLRELKFHSIKAGSDFYLDRPRRSIAVVCYDNAMAVAGKPRPGVQRILDRKLREAS